MAFEKSNTFFTFFLAVERRRIIVYLWHIGSFGMSFVRRISGFALTKMSGK
jgi:hypothetical protein